MKTSIKIKNDSEKYGNYQKERITRAASSSHAAKNVVDENIRDRNIEKIVFVYSELPVIYTGL